MLHYTSSFLKSKSILLVKRFFLLNAAFAVMVLYLISPVPLALICYQATQIAQIFHILQFVFDLSYSLLGMAALGFLMS